jgi:lysophospholipase L1-like esterase
MPPESDRPTRPAATAALFALSVALTLGLLEAAARRLADPTGGHRDILAQSAQARTWSVHVATDDPELVYVTRPGYSTNGVRISEAHGILRGADVAPGKPPGLFRIAVLGDSIAAAHPVRVGGHPSFADELERRLGGRDPARRVEVLNFGTDGYSTLQEARLLETRVAGFDPDLVVLQYCLNDPANSYTPTVWFLDGRAPRSYLLDLVRRRLGDTPSELNPAHPRYTHGAIDWKRLYEPDAEAWQGVRRGFARIAAWAGGDRHVPVVLVLFPLLMEAGEPATQRALMEGLYAQVRREAEAHGFRVVDLGPTFAKHEVSRLRLLPGDPIHPGAFGHVQAGAALAEAVATERLLGD